MKDVCQHCNAQKLEKSHQDSATPMEKSVYHSLRSLQWSWNSYYKKTLQLQSILEVKSKSTTLHSRWPPSEQSTTWPTKDFTPHSRFRASAITKLEDHFHFHFHRWNQNLYKCTYGRYKWGGQAMKQACW